MALDPRNLVPADDVDTYVLEVGDGFQLPCDGDLTVTPHRACRVTQRVRLEVLDGDAARSEAVSADGDPAGDRGRRPGLPASRRPHAHRPRVEPVGTDRSPEDYLLEPGGSF